MDAERNQLPPVQQLLKDVYELEINRSHCIILSAISVLWVQTFSATAAYLYHLDKKWGITGGSKAGNERLWI